MDLNGPGLQPPDGVIPNLVDPPNQNGIAWAVIVICIVVSTACLGVRGYARVYLVKKFQLEEAMILTAYGLFWGAIYSLIALTLEPGFFVHQWNVPMIQLIGVTYWIFIFGVMYTIVLPLLKVTILVEWCRMFVSGNKTSNPFFWGCVFVIFVQVAAGVGIVIAMNLQCTPHAGIWDFRILERQCFNLYNIQVTSATVHLVSDVIIFCLPQRIIWTLQMSWRKRAGVSIIFGLGLLACISAAFRMYATVAFGQSADATFNMGPLGFWAAGEMACGFFIVCVPCIPKILKDTGVMSRIKRRLGMKTTGKSNSKLGYYGGSAPSRGGLSSHVDAYHKLDEDSIGLNPLKSSPSEEKADQQHQHPGITRTTQIMVTADARTDRDAHNDVVPDYGRTGWAR